MKGEEDLIELFANRIDTNTCAHMNMQSEARWFALRLNLMPCLNILAVTILLVFFSSQVHPSLIALTLIYAISIPKSFQLSTRQFSDADMLMTSAERIKFMKQSSFEIILYIINLV